MSKVGTPASDAPTTLAVLRERVGRVAGPGSLGVPVERETTLIHAAGVSTVATLIADSLERRDPYVSPSARDAVLAAILIPSSTVVWVDTKSKIYHFAGSKNCGNTKTGAYKCETDATAAGDRASKTEKHP